LSLLAVATRLPSGLHATALTKPACPSGGVTGCPLTASHTRAVLSLLAVTTRLPSGLHATAKTKSACPSGGATGCPLTASHTRAVLLRNSLDRDHRNRSIAITENDRWRSPKPVHRDRWSGQSGRSP
jgi:hypothetical protein